MMITEIKKWFEYLESFQIFPIYCMATEAHVFQKTFKKKLLQKLKEKNFIHRTQYFIDEQSEDISFIFNQMDLFSTHAIIEIYFFNLKDLKKNIPLIPYDRTDLIIILMTPDIPWKERTHSWYQHMMRRALCVHIGIPKALDMRYWMLRHAQDYLLNIDSENLDLIEKWTHNNPDAVDQLFQTLNILYVDHEPVRVQGEMLSAVLHPNAQDSVFDLAHAVVHKRIGDAMRIAHELQKNQVNILSIVGALAYTFRASHGANSAILSQLSVLDQMAKALLPGHAWLSLNHFILMSSD